PAVACLEQMRTLVIRSRVVLVVERAVCDLDLPPSCELPADAGHEALAADAVAGDAPVGAPMADDVAFVGQAVSIDMVHVPAVLPLAGFEREVEVPRPDLRETQAGGEADVAEPGVAVGRCVLARVLEVDRERQPGRHREARRDRRDLVAEVARRAGVVVYRWA